MADREEGVWEMTSATVDDRGRLYLPKPLRERYGERFRIVQRHDGIKLIPLPEDPVEGLRQAMPGIQEASIEELRRQADQAARDDALR